MPAIAVELKAPDIERHRRSSTGTDFVHPLDSGKPGPHVMVNALTHGNEICGAIVVDRLLRDGVRPTRGKLTLAFANVAAFSRFDPAMPYATRYLDEYFTPLWTPTVPRAPRATPLIAAAQPRRRPARAGNGVTLPGLVLRPRRPVPLEPFAHVPSPLSQA